VHQDAFCGVLVETPKKSQAPKQQQPEGHLVDSTIVEMNPMWEG
jgi:hypothetical protein